MRGYKLGYWIVLIDVRIGIQRLGSKGLIVFWWAQELSFASCEVRAQVFVYSGCRIA